MNYFLLNDVWKMKVRYEYSSLRSHTIEILIQETTLVVLVVWLFYYQSKVLVCLIDRWDDEGGRVVTSIITGTWVEDWIERLTEGAASSRVEMNPGFHIIEGDQTLIIINKHPHLLELSSQWETDIRVITKYQPILVVGKNPVTMARSECDLIWYWPGDRGHS